MKNYPNVSKYNNLVVAKDKDDKTYYLVCVYKDGSSALMYDNGKGFETWCSISKLKNHIEYLSYLTKKDFLDNWDILNQEFFKQLNII